jgi:hypothetical protein
MITITTLPHNALVAERLLGGKVRQIDSNFSLGEVSYALASEAVGYPVNWTFTQFVTFGPKGNKVQSVTR